jgi:hypothetical protein
MTTLPSLIVVMVVLSLSMIAPVEHSFPQAPAGPHSATDSAPASDATVELKLALRKLWEDHITYTRNFIISSLAGLEDAGAVAERLLKNQEDIGAAVAPYYGEDAGTKLSALLKEHIQIAVDVVKAAKSQDKDQLAAAQKKWTANGKDIAAFLNGANQAWPKKDLEAMLQKHLDLTTGEVVGRLKKDWVADIKAYDDGHVHMLMFADMLADGIAKQFPAKLKK